MLILTAIPETKLKFQSEPLKMSEPWLALVVPK